MITVKVSPNLSRVIVHRSPGWIVLDIPGRPRAAVFGTRKGALAYARRPEELADA
jgi:hypothetical protein